MTRFWTLALAWLGGTPQQVLSPGTGSNAAIDRTTRPVPPFPVTTSIAPFQQRLRPKIYGPLFNVSESTGRPAIFADSHPKRWGEESASIRLPGNATAIHLALNADETLLAVGYQSNVLLYEFPPLKHVQTLQELGRVLKIEFLPGQRMFVSSSADTIEANDQFGRYSTSRLVDLDYELSKPFIGIDNIPSGVPRATSAVLQLISKEMEHERVRVETEELRDEVARLLTRIVKEDKTRKSLWFTKKPGYDHESIISPDGTFIVTSPEKHRRAIINSTTLEEKPVTGITFTHPDILHLRIQSIISPDSRLVAWLSGNTSYFQRIVTWNASDGNMAVHALDPPITAFLDCPIVISPDSRLMATFCEGSRLCIWNLTSGELVYSMDDSSMCWSSSVAFSPFGEYLAVANRERVLTLDMRTLDVQRHNLSHSSNARVNSVSFNEEGRLFCRLSDRVTIAYDMVTNIKWQFGTPRQPWVIGRLNNFVMTKEGFISGDYDGVIRVWKF